MRLSPGGIACHCVGTTDLKADAQRVVLAVVERFGRQDKWNVCRQD